MKKVIEKSLMTNQTNEQQLKLSAISVANWLSLQLQLQLQPQLEKSLRPTKQPNKQQLEVRAISVANATATELSNFSQ